MRSAGADRLRPKFRVVAGGAPVIEPVVEQVIEDDDHAVAVNASDPNGEDRSEKWLDSIEASLEERMDNGGSSAPFQPFPAVVENGNGESKTNVGKSKTDRDPKPRGPIRQTAQNESGSPSFKKLDTPSVKHFGSLGLKKRNKKQTLLDWPPAPRGCEWRRSDDGLNLWRCWTEWDDDKTKKIKKSRYAGHLSDDAWRIMKEYDHEAFISVVGERLRRHSGR
jgi:hypothetical protein